MEKISIITPTYNEKENLPILVKKLFADMRKYDVELIVVDDNSLDGTGKLADEFAKKNKKIKVVHRPRKMGLGSAFVDGTKVADGDVFLLMDADLSHDSKDFPKLLNKISEGYDIVVGSKYVSGGKTQDKPFRIFVSKMFCLFTSTFLWINIKDNMSGLFAIRREVLEKIKLNPIGFKVMIEIAFKAKKLGYKIIEVPITFHKRKHGKEKGGIKEAVRFLRLAFELRFGLR
jgi:dolichol-phosphate mannosyltransferase